MRNYKCRQLFLTAFITCRHTLAPRLAKLSHIMLLLIQLNYTTGTFTPNGILYMQEGDILGYKQKSMKQVHVTNNILYEKVGGIQDLKAIVV